MSNTTIGSEVAEFSESKDNLRATGYEKRTRKRVRYNEISYVTSQVNPVHGGDFLMANVLINFSYAIVDTSN